MTDNTKQKLYEWFKYNCKIIDTDENKITPESLNAISEKCFKCSGNSMDNVKLCPITLCPLYKYRPGIEKKINN